MPSHSTCREYTRTGLLRHGVATAGRGLPAIEPGMPAPAGTGLTRRSLLHRGMAAGLAVYGASRLGPGALEAGIAEAAEASAGQRVLVSVFMGGGVDNLSLLAPVGDPHYATLRPTLRVLPEEGTAYTEDTRLRWHPRPTGSRPSTPRGS
jgi:hypothetical protein